jgi:hypothetical protein
MRDNISNVQNSVVVTGKAGNVHNSVITPSMHQASLSVNWSELVPELIRLREALRTEATEPEHFTMLAEVQSAVIEAEKEEERPKALDRLSKIGSSKAGSWLLSIADKATVPVFVELIKHFVIGK